MALHLGDTAPDFSATTTEGDINFHQWMDGKWVVFFSHPADFTPVCTTELGATSQAARRICQAQRASHRHQRGPDRQA